MGEAGRRADRSDDRVLLGLFEAIVSRPAQDVARRLAQDPGLATAAIRVGATRNESDDYFLTPIRHHVYAGDTALHVAAAAHGPAVAELLVERGADVRARNRRGAEPLHYAADGRPGDERWDPAAQCQVIEYLIHAGVEPDTTDKSGVAPLHRAVRTRAADAVGALIRCGADPRLGNRRGSTPLHLAVQNTGRSDSGSEAAREEQRRIILLLLDHGADPSDVDGHGKPVAAAASSGWIRQLLERLDASPNR